MTDGGTVILYLHRLSYALDFTRESQRFGGGLTRENRATKQE